MIKIIGKSNDKHAMDILNENQIELIKNVTCEIDRHILLTEINYETGYVTFGYKYNEGTDNEWIREDFLRVNVGAESVPCIIWEIVNAVFKRCV